MNWNRDQVAFGVSQVLLLVLVLLWLRGVYNRELSGLKAETNVLFFNAIEEAKDKLFFNIRTQDRRLHSEFVFENSDTAVTEEIIVFDRKGVDLDQVHRKHLIRRHDIYSEGDSQVEVSMDYSTRGISAILISNDSLLDIDFDTTKSYLTDILLSKVRDSRLKRLKVTVVDTSDNLVDENQFRTDKASLGNIFFGTSQYAAEVGDYHWLVIRRMTPELFIALFMFGAIFSAFYLVYRNLQKERRLAVFKDEFIGNMSHELKTPISVVHVAVEALSNFDVLKDKRKTAEYLDISKRELTRLSVMVEKVLDVSTWNDGHVPLKLVEVDLMRIAQEVIDAMNLKHGYSDTDILYVAPAGPVTVDGDEEKLKIVLYNLLDNALKYTSERPVELTILAAKHDLIVEVADRGEGIPAEYKNQIFGKFFRIPNDNIHEVKGYGLGLYIVKEILNRHKGLIEVLDRPGGGSIARIRLPKVQ